MTRRRPVPGTPSGPAFAAIVLAVLAATVTGCGADKETRAYSVPGTLCGIRFDTKELTPFLVSFTETVEKSDACDRLTL